MSRFNGNILLRMWLLPIRGDDSSSTDKLRKDGSSWAFLKGLFSIDSAITEAIFV